MGALASMHSTASSESEDCQEGCRKCNRKTTLDSPVTSVPFLTSIADGIRIALTPPIAAHKPNDVISAGISVAGVVLQGREMFASAHLVT